MPAELDIPCDVQGRDREGRLWAFLDEAAHPESVVVGQLVVTGDEADPVVARVLDVVERPGGTKVTMEPASHTADHSATVSRRAGSSWLEVAPDEAGRVGAERTGLRGDELL